MEMMNIKKLKTTIWIKNPQKKVKTFSSDKNVSKLNDLEETRKCESLTKISTGSNANNNSAKFDSRDEENDDFKFRQALSLPVNSNRKDKY